LQSRRTLATVLVAVLAVLLLATACQPTYAPGPTGKVTDRSRAYWKSGGWHYWLTTTGSRFRVTRNDYEHCFHGSHYPTCTQH
jgi:hypothetical protein